MLLIEQRYSPSSSKVAASTRLVEPLTRAFVAAIKKFVHDNALPMICFEKGQRKEEVAAHLRARFPKKEGLIFVGKAQEKCTVYRTERRRNPRSGKNYAWIVKSPALVNHYYFQRRLRPKVGFSV